MKRIASIVAILLSISAATAQEHQERHIPFIAKIGDTANVSIVHRRIDTSDYGSKTTEATLTYQVEIVGTTEGGYRLTWHPRSISARGKTIDTTTERPEVEQDIALEFETDEAGMPVAMLNYDAVRQNGIKAVEVESTRYGQGVVDGVKAMFGKLDAVSAVGALGKYAQLIGLFQGVSIAVGVPRTYESQLPSPMGSGSVDATGSMELTTIDERNETATFKWQQRAEPESAKRLIVALMKVASKHTGKPVDEAKIKESKLQMTYEATATVALSDGWVRTLHYEQSVLTNDGSGNNNRTEVFEISIEK